MPDKTVSERLGVAENRLSGHDEKIGEHEKRLDGLETRDEERKDALLKTSVKAMWWCVRLLAMVTVMTFFAEKSKEKWLTIIQAWGL